MTAQEVQQIITASACIQCLCDVIAHYTVYKTRPYQQLRQQLDSCRDKLQSAREKLKLDEETNRKDSSTLSVAQSVKNTKRGTANEKQQKLVQRLEQEHTNLVASVAMQH
jgi:cell division protein FtsL